MSNRPNYNTHLVVKWSKKENDLLIGGPNGPDRHLTHGFFNRTPILTWDGKVAYENFVKELENRGYDITTLKFSIKRKWASGEKPPDDYHYTSQV